MERHVSEPGGDVPEQAARLREVADLVAQRNEIDQELANIVGRPVVAGHLGEWIAGQIFGIELESSGSQRGYDGRFTRGDLAGRSVNVKWYSRQQGLLDISPHPADYYLVLAGPTSAAASSRDAHRPLVIVAVYLFDMAALLAVLADAGRRPGTATSVKSQHWAEAQIFPAPSSRFPLSADQVEALELFSSSRARRRDRFITRPGDMVITSPACRNPDLVVSRVEHPTGAELIEQVVDALRSAGRGAEADLFLDEVRKVSSSSGITDLVMRFVAVR